jgi:phosphate starvation-inducible protein PhoH
MKKSGHINDNSNEDMGESKRRGRKSKKQNDKELMYEYGLEIEREREKTVANQKKMYENIQHLSQKEKTGFENKFTKPKNRHQEEYVTLLKNSEKKIVVATGPAGTGKTLFACEHGVKNYLLGNCEKLIFTRPSVSVDEELGFLPGTLEEKMAPWVRPIYDVLYNFISPKEVENLMEEKIIEIAPLGYMRGRTFKNSWIIADEMQNSTVSQMKMLLTRLGENSRLVITGDLDQHDRMNEINGLEDFLNKFRGKRSSSITSYEFQRSDIQREEVVREVLDIYSGDIPASYRECKEEVEIELEEFTKLESKDDGEKDNII